MTRAYIEQGEWRVSTVDACDAPQQKLATLRVSFFAAVAALAMATGALPPTQPDSDLVSSRAVRMSAPEIVRKNADERVPSMEAATTAVLQSRSASTLATSENLLITASYGPSQRPATASVTPLGETEAVQSNVVRFADIELQLSGIVPPADDAMCRRVDGLAVRCVDRALSYLQLLIRGRKVQCERGVQPTDGMPSGQCRIGDSDVAEQLVRQGWAKAGEKPEERFLVAEEAARKQKLGIWR